MRRRIAFKLLAVVATIFALGLGTTALLDLAAARRAVTEQAAEGSLSTLRLAWGAIRHEMFEDEGKIIAPCFEEIVSEHGLKRIAFYDRDGAVVASAPRERTGVSGLGSPLDATCRSCHGSPRVVSQGADTAWVVQTGRERTMRTVLHIRNEPACHRCHKANERIRGVLVADSSLSRSEATAAAMARRSLTSAVAAFLLLEVALAWLLRNLVHRPVRLLERATTRVAAGEFEHRVAIAGKDEFSDLGRAFNEMTASLGEMTARLQALATTDYLTSLPNHRHLQDRLKEEVSRAERYHRPFSLLMVDIDHFKAINDLYGHPAGDDVLKELAAVLRGNLRAADVVARYGGEEFAAILPETAAAEAGQVAERVRAGVEEHVFQVVPAADTPDPSPTPLRLTVSIGIAEFLSDSVRPEGLVMAADVALLRAKHLSRNAVCAYDALLQAGESDDPYLLHQSLQEGTVESVAALVEALEARDPYLRGHSGRVARYAIAVARRLGLAEDDMGALRLASLLHDVGKIGIPDTILGKPGVLTPEERRLIQTHPGVGGSIVKMVSRLANLVPIIVHHHERYDGKGYPDGLAGDRIPLLSRILAAVEAYDATLSDRPYRPAHSEERALNELREGAGSQFDPRVVEALAAHLAEIPAGAPA